VLTFVVDGQPAAEIDQNVIESVKKKLMSIRLSEALLFVVRSLIVDAWLLLTSTSSKSTVWCCVLQYCLIL